MIKCKVIKIQTLPNKNEDKMYIKSGDIFKGQFINYPTVGESFTLWNKSIEVELRTTPVIEIISDREFKTLNSIYRIITLDDERDGIIKMILE